MSGETRTGLRPSSYRLTLGLSPAPVSSILGLLYDMRSPSDRKTPPKALFKRQLCKLSTSICLFPSIFVQPLCAQTSSYMEPVLDFYTLQSCHMRFKQKINLSTNISFSLTAGSCSDMWPVVSQTRSTLIKSHT